MDAFNTILELVKKHPAEITMDHIHRVTGISRKEIFHHKDQINDIIGERKVLGSKHYTELYVSRITSGMYKEKTIREVEDESGMRKGYLDSLVGRYGLRSYFCLSYYERERRRKRESNISLIKSLTDRPTVEVFCERTGIRAARVYSLFRELPELRQYFNVILVDDKTTIEGYVEKIKSESSKQGRPLTFKEVKKLLSEHTNGDIYNLLTIRKKEMGEAYVGDAEAKKIKIIEGLKKVKYHINPTQAALLIADEIVSPQFVKEHSEELNNRFGRRVIVSEKEILKFKVEQIKSRKFRVQSEYAEDWGVTKSCVSNIVRKYSLSEYFPHARKRKI